MSKVSRTPLWDRKKPPAKLTDEYIEYAPPCATHGPRERTRRSHYGYLKCSKCGCMYGNCQKCGEFSEWLSDTKLFCVGCAEAEHKAGVESLQEG